jgi:hypothetical protein
VKPPTQLKFVLYSMVGLHTQHKHGLNGILGIAWVKQRVLLFCYTSHVYFKFFDILEYSLLDYMSY